MSLRVGSLCFATNQGLGVLARSFYTAGIVTDVMVVRHGKRPENEDWYPGATRITNLNDQEQLQNMADFCKSVDVMLFFETPFVWPLLNKCKEYRVKTVLMPMYECMPKVLLSQPDLFLCPSLLDLSYYPGEDTYEGFADVGDDVVEMKKTRNTSSVYLPIPVEYPWKQRTKAEIFVHNAGHGGLKGRNGTQEFLEAIQYVKSDAKFVLRVQEGEFDFRFAMERKLLDRIKDRLMIEGTLLYDQLFANGDVFVFPEKFNGLSLPLQEARAAGMLVMATDRFPNNMWLPNRVQYGVPGISPSLDLNPLIPVASMRTNNVSPRCNDFEEAVIDPRQLAAKIDEWYGRDITDYSIQGKAWAEENSWAILGPKYKEVFESLVKS